MNVGGRDGALAVPQVELQVDGSALGAGAERSVASVRVRRELGAPAACELRFTSTRAGSFDAALDRLTVGAEIGLTVAGAGGQLFRGEVLSLEHRYAADGLVSLVVRGQDRAHRWRQDARIRVFVDVTVGDLVREVAAEIGLAAEIVDDGPRWPRFVQDGRSTLDLVADLVARAGLRWQVDVTSSTVRLFRTPGAGAPIVLRYGDSLLEVVVGHTAIGLHDSWRVRTWDPVTGEVADETNDAAVDPAAQGAVELSTGIRAGGMLPSADHAAAAAAALGARDVAGARTMRAVALGDVALVPGAVVRVEGLAPQAVGEFMLTSADHVVDAEGGYTCTLSSVPPPEPAPRASTGPLAHTTPAEVLRVDDPESRGRVRVALLSYDGSESEWLPVLALGAGQDKGLTCQPDVGDHVLVAHDAGDPGRGVVLGGLRDGGGSEPSAGVVDGAVGAYALRLPGGQVIRLDAAADEVSLVNDAGSRLVIDRSGTVLHSAGDLTIEAPGNRLVLRAARIDMERG